MTRVVVTGASRGIGRALADQYLARGDEVWAGCRSVGSAGDLARAGAFVRRLDVADPASIDDFCADVDDGVRGVDLLINNAAIDAGALGAGAAQRGPLHLPGEDFIQVMRVNALGPMLVTRGLLQALRRANTPIVVNVSSELGSLVVGAVWGADIGYNASKAALNSITVKTANELRAEGITVVVVHPGWVRTDMGGPEAPLDVSDATRDLISTIDSLDISRTGEFLERDGSTHPW
jgi:NAD(P)-dependent dehydrogenase (short-subunit alcohol dehydrogenase family)